MKKKLTEKEIEAYSIVQRIRANIGVEKAGKKGMSMSNRGKKAAEARWKKKKK